MWADGGPIDPLPTVDQAVNGGYSWLEITGEKEDPALAA